MIRVSRVVAVAMLVLGLVNLVYADTFSPATAAPGGTVTLTGQAKPNSAMSGYFSCNARCGQTHIGVATANAQGQYSLTFTVPAAAKPGGAYVQIGCDNCGNGWRTVSGLQIQAGAQSQQSSSTDTFSSTAVAPGGAVTLTGQAKPNSTMSGYFSCNSGCGQTHIGVATTNAVGQYSLSFNVPVNAKSGEAFVDIGCDNCGNGWRRVSGLTVKYNQVEDSKFSGSWPIFNIDKNTPPPQDGSMLTGKQTGCMSIQGQQATIQRGDRNLQGELIVRKGCINTRCQGAVVINGEYVVSLSYFAPYSRPNGKVEQLYILYSTNDNYFNTNAVAERRIGDANQLCKVPVNAGNNPVSPPPLPKTKYGCAEGVNCQALTGYWYVRMTQGTYTLAIKPDGTCSMNLSASGGGQTINQNTPGNWSSANGQIIDITDCGIRDSGTVIGSRLITKNWTFER